MINAVSAEFFDFTLEFFRQIVDAKLHGRDIGMSWYRERFIDGDIAPDEAVIFAGLNRKTVTNIYGTSAREVMLDAARNNFTYLRGILVGLENDADNNLAVTITISHNDISVKLSLTESLIVINALATKKRK